MNFDVLGILGKNTRSQVFIDPDPLEVSNSTPHSTPGQTSLLLPGKVSDSRTHERRVSVLWTVVRTDEDSNLFGPGTVHSKIPVLFYFTEVYRKLPGTNRGMKEVGMSLSVKCHVFCLF